MKTYQQSLHQSRFAWKFREFRSFLYTSFIARVAEWMEMTVMNWTVLQTTHSPLYLGLINACRLVPAFVMSVPAGVLADRLDRKKLYLFTQWCVFLCSCMVAASVVWQSFWLLAAFVTLRSVFLAMDIPIRNVLICQMVPKESWPSAISFHTAMLNIARMVGPALAGILLMKLSPSLLMWICAFSVLPVIAGLWLIPIKPCEAKDCPRSRGMKRDAKEAIQYIKKEPLVQSLFLLAVVPMIFGFPYTSMLPLFARDLFRFEVDEFGLLLSASAVGALLGTFVLSFVRLERPGKWLILSVAGFGLFLLLFFWSEQFLVALMMMFFVGFLSQFYRTLSRITLQMTVPDHLRGRILSIALMDRGLIPLGAMLIGMVAEGWGAMAAGMIMGMGLLIVPLFLVIFRRQIWDL